MLTLLLLLVVTAMFVWTRRPKRPKNFPPGPPTFLIFGNLVETLETVKGKFNEMLARNRKEYGDILAIVMTSGHKMLHLFNFDDIKETCSRPEFNGRSTTFLIMERSFQKKLGLIFSDGPPWLEHRRFALRHLKDLGFGTRSMETIVHEEFDLLAQEMEEELGRPMKVNCRFNLTVLNVLWRVVAGKRLDTSAPESKRYATLVDEFFRVVKPTNPLALVPWIRHILPERSGHQAIVRHRDTTNAMFLQEMREHRETLDPAAPRDFIDHFLIEAQSPDAEERFFTDENLAIIGMDFFVAGMETTSTSLTWALLFMVMFPDVQKRVQQEIDTVLAGRAPSYADRTNMPYTEATLLEMSRRATVLPRSVGHSTMSDATLKGYTVPRNTLVLMHLEAVHMDKAYWGDPEEFRPERFLAPPGDDPSAPRAIRRDERVMPFGVGKRACLGETLARTEMFVFFASLLQRFSFVAAPGQKLTLNGTINAVSHPAEFCVTYQLRH